MKKRVLFMTINMNIGGTEKALLNMIYEMSPEEYDITLLMLEEYGGFLDYIPSHVKVIYLKEYREIKDMIKNPPLQSVKATFQQGNYLSACNILFINIITKLKKDPSLFFKYLLRPYPETQTEYDIAIAYAGPMDFISYFVIKKIKAEKKYQWIHFDITKIGFNKIFAAKIYKNFDKIFVVSDQGKEKLTKAIPNLKNKIETFLNIISPNQIVQMAKEGDGFRDDFNGYRILTVGRLSEEKGQELAIRVLAKLIKEGLDVRWYCVGSGNAIGEYKALIKKYGVEQDFILLGEKANPYPYMQQCDLYIQPSRHEGYCITLAEAKCFSNPIITTDFTGAKEQISNGSTGLIVSYDEVQLYDSILRLLYDDMLRYKIHKNLEAQNIIHNKSTLSRIIEF